MTNARLRWYGAITLFVVTAISYVDRINIAVLITDQSFLRHVGLAAQDRASQGLLATAFMVGYGVSSIVVTPFCSTLLGVRRSLALGLLLWGVVTALSPLLEGYGLTLASRLLLGVAEGPVFSLAGAYIKANFAAHENGKPNSLVNMGTGLGLAVGFPFVGLMLANFNWQTSFYGVAALNLLIGLPAVIAFIRMPFEEGRSGSGAGVTSVGAVVAGALKTRHLLLITVLTCATLAYLWGTSSWLPAYLKDARGVSLREMGWLASLPQYSTVLGVFIGGAIIDMIARRNVPLIFVLASIGVAGFIVMAVNASNAYGAVYALIAANLCWGLLSPAIPSTAQYFSRPEHIASAYGVINGVGSLVAGFMPTIMGAVIASVSGGQANSQAGFYAGFLTLIGTQAIVCLCGAILYFKHRSEDAAGA